MGMKMQDSSFSQSFGPSLTQVGVHCTDYRLIGFKGAVNGISSDPPILKF